MTATLVKMQLPRLSKQASLRALGAGVFMTARVSRGELTWEQTDVYDSAS